MIPLKCSKIRLTSDYGNRTFIMQGKKYSDFHYGIDIVPADGTGNSKILCVADGEVTAVRKTGEQYGNACYIRIKHSNGLYSVYYHLKTNTIKLNVGDKVKKGDELGIIGTTGISTGIHLHFQIDKGSNASSINPKDFVFNNVELFESKQTSTKPKSEQKKNNYKTLGTMYVRTGPGTIYTKKTVRQLTSDGKKNATSTNPNDYAIYKKGTVFTAQEIVNNRYGTWAKTPSGYVCIKGQSKTVYCVKC